MKKLVVLLFVSFVTTFSSAANWVATGSNPSKGLYGYVDTESISTQGNYKQAFSKAINIPGGNYVIALVSYDCKSKPRRSKSTHITVFDLEGNVSGSRAVNYSFTPVLPESMAEGEMSVVCKF